jgi:PTH2 family peptidyl-tRNA hydrolase
MDYSSYALTATVLGGAGLIMFMLLRRQTRPLINMPTGDCKLVILVRTDLNMTKGKAAAQCCHAVLETYKQATRNYPEMVQRWEDLGQPKITLKVESDAELAELVGKARKAGLAAQAIRDAGRTQLIPGTRTVAAIGPGPAKMIDIITGHLKLY